MRQFLTVKNVTMIFSVCDFIGLQCAFLHVWVKEWMVRGLIIWNFLHLEISALCGIFNVADGRVKPLCMLIIRVCKYMLSYVLSESWNLDH